MFFLLFSSSSMQIQNLIFDLKKGDDSHLGKKTEWNGFQTTIGFLLSYGHFCSKRWSTVLPFDCYHNRFCVHSSDERFLLRRLWFCTWQTTSHFLYKIIQPMINFLERFCNSNSHILHICKLMALFFLCFFCLFVCFLNKGISCYGWTIFFRESLIMKDKIAQGKKFLWLAIDVPSLKFK